MVAVTGPDHPGVYAARRARALAELGDDAALVLAAAPEIRVGRDLDLRYRPDPDLFYLTGYTEPGAVVVLCPDHEDATFTMFVRPRDPDRELWDGPRGGPDAVIERYGADAAHPISELAERLPAILRSAARIFAPPSPDDAALGAVLHRLATSARSARQRTGRGARAFMDTGVLLDEMRLVKDAHEIRLIRDAADVTVAAFTEAARSIRPGAGEWEIEAALEAGFRRRGADGSAFAPIVGGGANATVLHYTANSAPLEAGTLLLIDAGARHRMYSADVSRTFPVSGRFEGRQLELYQAVLAARDASIAAVRPGATTDDVHAAALKVLIQALIDLRLLEGDADALLEREQIYKRFYPHRTSHWLGLDVHDVGDYATGGRSRQLEPGMVLTVEPGLYLAGSGTPAGSAGAEGSGPPQPQVPEGYRGIGIRIEDDVLVTADGREVLTAALGAEPVDVEAMLAG